MLWRWLQVWLGLRAEDLVFGDESGSNKALAPCYGYAPKGKRSHGRVPRNRGRNTSILATMGAEGLVGTMTVEGATNTEVFLTYLDQVLCPALRPGQVVILGNLSARKNDAVCGRIEACGCRLVFLPAYSPDFNLNRTRLLQAQGLPAQSQSSHARNPGSRHRQRPRYHHA